MNGFEKILKRPSWVPPPITFPVMWLIVKILWTCAASMSFLTLSQSGGGRREALRSPAIISYVAHLSLANIWNSLYLEENQLGACVTVSIIPQQWARQH